MADIGGLLVALSRWGHPIHYSHFLLRSSSVLTHLHLPKQLTSLGLLERPHAPCTAGESGRRPRSSLTAFSSRSEVYNRYKPLPSLFPLSFFSSAPGAPKPSPDAPKPSPDVQSPSRRSETSSSPCLPQSSNVPEHVIPTTRPLVSFLRWLWIISLTISSQAPNAHLPHRPPHDPRWGKCFTLRRNLPQKSNGNPATVSRMTRFWNFYGQNLVICLLFPHHM